MKASVPKLFNCPGATRLFLTPSQEIGWLVIAASRDRLKNLQHRGIAPSWSRKPPQTHQDFRLKRFGLRARLSAPAQDKTITPHPPLSQWRPFMAALGPLPRGENAPDEPMNRPPTQGSQGRQRPLLERAALDPHPTNESDNPTHRAPTKPPPDPRSWAWPPGKRWSAPSQHSPN